MYRIVTNRVWSVNAYDDPLIHLSCGIKVPKGEKAKPVVLQYVLDNEPKFVVEYTKHGNPKPDSFDKADSWVMAKAGFYQKTA